MYLWLTIFLLLLILTHFLLVLVFVHPVAVWVAAKLQLPILGNKGVWFADGLSDLNF